MYPGGAQGFTGLSPQEEENEFFTGNGCTSLDLAASADYRFERIIQDIYVNCIGSAQENETVEVREMAIRYMLSNFVPGGTIERAFIALNDYSSQHRFVSKNAFGART